MKSRLSSSMPKALASRYSQSPSHSGEAYLIHLQQTLGNRFVSQLMQAQKSEPDSQLAGGQSQINGTGLPVPLKAGLEGLSGIDLSDVRVHYNSDKPEQIYAKAFTQGSEIYVAPGQERHLPHEGWHAVQQKQGRVQATVQAKGRPINDSEALEQEADVMGERAAVHAGQGGASVAAEAIDTGSGKTDAGGGMAGSPGFTSSANQPIQGMFVLTRIYTPNDDNIKALFQEEEVELEMGKCYVVKGFDFNGNFFLDEIQSGCTFMVNGDLDHRFSVVPDELEESQVPFSPQTEYQQLDRQQLPFIGFSEGVVSSWEQQIFEEGCWLAVMAVISGRTQKGIQKQLGWSDDAFYRVSSDQLVEFGQHVQFPIVKLTNDELTAKFVAQTLGGVTPIVLGVPDHAMILFAISSDLSLVRIWDPADCSVQQVPFQLMKKYVEDAFVRS